MYSIISNKVLNHDVVVWIDDDGIWEIGYFGEKRDWGINDKPVRFSLCRNDEIVWSGSFGPSF